MIRNHNLLLHAHLSVTRGNCCTAPLTRNLLLRGNYLYINFNLFFFGLSEFGCELYMHTLDKHQEIQREPVWDRCHEAWLGLFNVSLHHLKKGMNAFNLKIIERLKDIGGKYNVIPTTTVLINLWLCLAPCTANTVSNYRESQTSLKERLKLNSFKLLSSNLTLKFW